MIFYKLNFNLEKWKEKMVTAGLIITGIGVLVSAISVGFSIFRPPWYATTWGMCIIIGGILAIALGVWVIALKSRKR